MFDWALNTSLRFVKKLRHLNESKRNKINRCFKYEVKRENISKNIKNKKKFLR